MDVIMFHSGREGLPSHLEDNFKQLRLFNPDVTIYFLTDADLTKDPLFEKYKVRSVNKDEYDSNKIGRFVMHFQYSTKTVAQQFWVITATRLIYIENFMRAKHLKSVFHFENDILLYCDLHSFYTKFLELYPNMAITVGGPDKCMTGLMFIRNCQALDKMTKFFIEKLLLGKNQLRQIYKMDMVNEMTLMRAYSKDYPDQLQFLPILPFGDFSTNYSEFNSIFDPASWGQFVGGSAQEMKPGTKPTDHYIGQLLIEHPEYSVIWKRDKRKRNQPYFKYDGQEVRINNLHIHSKELYKYLS